MRKALVLSLLILLSVVTPTHSQGDLAVVMDTDPASGQIGPDDTLAKTTLKVIDAAGRLVPNAYLKLHLDAPPGNPIISTDFPIVENTPLIKYEGFLADGTLTFEYIYPIRGAYNFQIEAGRDASALSFRDDLKLNLRENRVEVVNFVILFLILLGLGLAAGFIIGRGAGAQRLAASGIVLLLGLGLIGGSTSVARAHGGDPGSKVQPFTESAANGDLTMTLAMNPGAGRVGSLNRLNFSAMDSKGDLVSDTTFEVTFWHIEDEKRTFAASLYAPTGETSLAYQFFDGAEHEISLTAHNTLGTVELGRIVEVEAISPPLSIKIKTAIYLVLITLIGILMGLRLQVIQSRKQQLMPLRA